MLDEAIVLVGGLGTRLRHVVTDVPKPMAPIGGRPFLELLLEYLQQRDFRRIVLCVGYLRETITTHFGARFGALDIAYSVEDQPLGTGGAIARALGTVDSRSVFILNGDTFLEIDYCAMRSAHTRTESPLSLAVRRVSDAGRYDEIALDNDRIVDVRAGRRGCGGWINGGVYVASKNLLDNFELPACFSFERDFLRPFAARIDARAFRSSDYFIDIGVPDDYRRAQVDLPTRLTRVKRNTPREA